MNNYKSLYNPDWKRINRIRIKENEHFQLILFDGKTKNFQGTRRELNKEIERIEAGCNLVEV